MRTISQAVPGDIQAFLAVVDASSFREASRRLDIPKSTLSARVQNLEECLGMRLLTRTTRNLRLTEPGETFYREASAAMDALHSAAARVMEQSESPRGRLRMTAPYELGQRFMGGVLATYARRYPDVRVELDLVDRQVNLVEEGYDLALRVGPLAESTLIARKVGPAQKQCLYASPHYLEEFGSPKRPTDVRQHRCLVKAGGRTPRAWTFRMNGRHVSVAVDPHIEVNSFLVLAELAEAGAGIVSLPQSLVEDLKLNLTKVLEAYESPERECFVVYPGARTTAPALRSMVDLILEEFASVVWTQSKCPELVSRCSGAGTKTLAKGKTG
jgi:DNA-binding transcriptional LysR family regulator